MLISTFSTQLTVSFGIGQLQQALVLPASCQDYLIRLGTRTATCYLPGAFVTDRPTHMMSAGALAHLIGAASSSS
jgi:hypothetical protein